MEGRRCQFWLPKKNRYCSNSPLLPSLYCGNHSTRPNHKWVTCPIDPSHSVLEDNLESHVKRCPVYKRAHSLSLQPYFLKGINSPQQGDDEEEDESDFTSEMKRNWVHSLTLTQFHHLLSKIHTLHSSISHLIPFSYKLPPSSNTWIQAHLLDGKIPYQRKHILQQASILANLEDFQLLPSENDTPAVVEFGAGRGYLTQMLALSYPINKVFLVERNSYKFKADRSLRQNEGLLLERLRIDIEDLNLNAVESLRGVPYLAIGKHLCGPATDLTLRCCLGEHCNQDNGTEPCAHKHLRGITLATCCHHLCQWKHYTNKSYMLSLGISKDEFHAITWFTSWAVDADHGSDLSDDSYSQLPVPPGDSSNYDECASGVAEVVKNMKAVERAALGFMCKDIIDVGRFKWLEEHGLDAKLVKYVPSSISPENRLIVGKATNNKAFLRGHA